MSRRTETIPRIKISITEQINYPKITDIKHLNKELIEKIFSGFQQVKDNDISDSEKLDKFCKFLKVFECDKIFDEDRIGNLACLLEKAYQEDSGLFYFLIRGLAEEVGMLEKLLVRLKNSFEAKFTANILYAFQKLIEEKIIEINLLMSGIY